MPKKLAIEASLDDTSEKLEKLGYSILDRYGPVESEVDGDDTQEVSYMTAESSVGTFYIAFSDYFEFATIAYPYNVSRFLGNQLSNDEINSILDTNIDFEDIEDDEKAKLEEKGGESIISNTAESMIRRGKFYLFLYGSSPQVQYYPVLADNGFPTSFRCEGTFFPY